MQKTAAINSSAFTILNVQVKNEKHDARQGMLLMHSAAAATTGQSNLTPVKIMW